jgi:hypothetical protein
MILPLIEKTPVADLKGYWSATRVAQSSVATGRIERTQCCASSADEGADVGADGGTPVTEVYKVPFRFDGKIARVTIELKEMKKAVLQPLPEATDVYCFDQLRERAVAKQNSGQPAKIR